LICVYIRAESVWRGRKSSHAASGHSDDITWRKERGVYKDNIYKGRERVGE